MIYDTTKVSKELILSKVTEYDIFRYYIGKNIKLGTIVKSPLRKEDNPSFGIFKSKSGVLLFNDFATSTKGDCFIFVSKLHNLTYNKTLKLIYDDLVRGCIKQTDFGIEVRDEYKPSDKEIIVQTRYYVDCDELYWSQFNISKNTVKLFDVKPIHHFWVDSIKSKILHTEDSPLYAYLVNGRYRIYKPLAKRIEKWRGNLSLFDIFGYNQLPDLGNLLIITKSLKDVMCLYELGFNAIAPASETATIPEKIMDELKIRFNTIIVLYDNDSPGISAAKKICDKHALKSIIMPFFDDIVTKDISDYIKLKGSENALKTLNTLIYDIQ